MAKIKLYIEGTGDETLTTYKEGYWEMDESVVVSALTDHENDTGSVLAKIIKKAELCDVSAAEVAAAALERVLQECQFFPHEKQLIQAAKAFCKHVKTDNY